MKIVLKSWIVTCCRINKYYPRFSKDKKHHVNLTPHDRTNDIRLVNRWSVRLLGLKLSLMKEIKS